MGVSIGASAISDVKLGSTQVDKIYLGSTEVWSKTPPVAIKALKFTSTGVQTLGVNTTKLGTISPNFEYSTDGGTTWTTWDVRNDTLAFGNGTDLYVRGSNTMLATTGVNYTNFIFSTSSQVNCSGNIMHLYDYTQDLTSFPSNSSSDRGLKYLFQYCTQLVTAPSLPATVLKDYCYYYMFDGCVSLISPPALPAMVALNSCYNHMFSGCVSLSNITSLPATVLGSACYEGMFKGCQLIRVSTTQTGNYTNEFTFGINPSGYGDTMFTNTGGTYTGNAAQQTYYTSNTIIS